MDTGLINTYDSIKNTVSPPPYQNNLINVGDKRGFQHPGAIKWRKMAFDQSNKLKEGCAKRLILDIYCKILPHDADYVAGNQGTLAQDVDNFLAAKGMSAQQYLTSCGEKTQAPLVEFVLRSCDNIAKQFMEKADETLKDAQDNGIDIPPPESDAESEETNSQIVEIEKDDEFESFIGKLKKRTIDKLVGDITDLIRGKKEETDMQFKTSSKTESVARPVSVAVDYFNRKIWNENMELTADQFEEVMGLAIREATLNIIDEVFEQPDAGIRPYTSRVQLGKGIVMNESAVIDLLEKFDLKLL